MRPVSARTPGPSCSKAETRWAEKCLISRGQVLSRHILSRKWILVQSPGWDPCLCHGSPPVGLVLGTCVCIC